MVQIEEIEVEGYERVVSAKDPSSGLRCFIAIHSTLLGPSLGGVRLWHYETDKEALHDALRLAQAMTYKNALAEVGLGGGKAVIASEQVHGAKRRQLLQAFAEVVGYLQGDYIAAEDVGTTSADMAIIKEKVPYVAALSTIKSSGDPSRFTAWGVLKGMQACAEAVWGSEELKGKRVAIEGAGHVGGKLAELLFWHGAELLLSEIDDKRLSMFCHTTGAKAIGDGCFYSTECDILCPCALGGGINSQTIPHIRAPIIAGSANNQLADSLCAEALFEKGILYAPDYVINSGGIINASMEFAEGGYDATAAREKTFAIGGRLKKIFELSRLQNKNCEKIAAALAEQYLAAGVGRRKSAIEFSHHL